MLPGNFFYRDNSAALAGGLVYYRYRKCMPYNLRGVPFDHTRMHQYPIYVVLQNDAVRFYSHRMQKPSGDIAGYGVQNAEIFRIPLSGRNTYNDELTDTLGRIPLMDSAGGELYYDDRSVDNKIAHTFYSDLSCFSRPVRHGRQVQSGWIMNLFLDFLYDLVHTTVFEKDPSYEHVNSLLNTNQLFAAIAVKAEYHYCYQRWTTAPDYLRHLHLTQLIRAKKKFLAFITRDNGKIMGKFRSWFANEEKELADVYERLPIQNDHNDANREQNTERLLWHLRRFNFMGIFRPWDAVLLILIPLLFLDNYLGNSLLPFSHITFIFIIPPVFIIIYWIISIKLLIQYRNGLVGFSMLVPRLMFSILSSWLIVITSKEIWLSALRLPSQQVLLICAAITLAVGFFFSLEINKATGRFNIGRAIFILILSLSYCFTFGLLMMHFMGDAMLEEHKADILKQWAGTGFNNKENIFGINIYPPILIFDSFFVLFISVFIQAFFQDKPVTQST